MSKIVCTAPYFTKARGDLQAQPPIPNPFPPPASVRMHPLPTRLRRLLSLDEAIGLLPPSLADAPFYIGYSVLPASALHRIHSVSHPHRHSSRAFRHWTIRCPSSPGCPTYAFLVADAKGALGLPSGDHPQGASFLRAVLYIGRRVRGDTVHPGRSGLFPASGAIGRLKSRLDAPAQWCALPLLRRHDRTENGYCCF